MARWIDSDDDRNFKYGYTGMDRTPATWEYNPPCSPKVPPKSLCRRLRGWFAAKLHKIAAWIGGE